MRLWFGVLSAVAVAAVAAVTASPASAAPALQSASAKTCYTGYTHATFFWGERCLRAGQYCKESRNAQYKKYRFKCSKAGKLATIRGKK